MNILEQIVSEKQREIKELKLHYPSSLLEKSIFFQENTRSLKQAILRKGTPGIISEFKRISPSRGILNESALAKDVCLGYLEAGSSAISVLTDSGFFGGSKDDLTEVRHNVECPVLRKDFIIDEYQIVEARSIGADAVLLIAELHPADRLEKLFRFAGSLGLEVLVEVHDKENISRIPYDADIVGINSRNLTTSSVDLDHLSELIHFMPINVAKVAESGIKSLADYITLRNLGFNAFLIGEYFMSTPNPATTCREFIIQIGKFYNIQTIQNKT